MQVILKLVWLLTIVVFSAFYPSSRYGRRIAYMTVASFVFLGVVMGIMLYFPHAGGSTGPVHEVGNATAIIRGMVTGRWWP